MRKLVEAEDECGTYGCAYFFCTRLWPEADNDYGPVFGLAIKHEEAVFGVGSLASDGTDRMYGVERRNVTPAMVADKLLAAPYDGD